MIGMVMKLAAWLGFAAVIGSSMAASAQEYRSFVPAGSGRFPAVIFVSGCSGFVPFGQVDTYVEKAEAMRQDGYLVIFVDYLGKRGLKTCVSHQDSLYDEGARDVLQAAAWLKAQPNVDPARIDMIGWSYGGGIGLAALRLMPAAAPPLRKIAMLYPDCRPLQAAKANVPTLMLLAGGDNVAPTKYCADAAGKLAPGTVRSVTYPGAYHGFDARGLPAKTQYPLGTIGYSEAADKAAWAEIKGFLK